MQRSMEFHATLVAIWKAGKKYMPLDHHFRSNVFSTCFPPRKQALLLQILWGSHLQELGKQTNSVGNFP